MHQLEIGSILQASHPKNDFELIKDGSEVLLLAGGMVSHR